MNNSTRNIHPNRLVLKHEQYLIDKSLANKIKNTKSTLNSGNQTFERIIINRQKKDLQRSVLLKARSTECPVDSETTQTDQTLSSLSPHSCIISSKRNEMQPLRIITQSARENIENKASSLFSARNGLLLPLIASPRVGIERGSGLKSSVYSSAGKRIVEGIISPDRAGYMVDMRTKENQVETLKNRLIEKSLEAECIRKELKGWWHDDINTNKSKENILEQSCIRPIESSLTHSLQDISSNTIKRDLNTKPGLSKGYSDRKLKKMMSLGVEERKQLIGSVTKLATYEESLRILERFEELEKSNKKSLTPGSNNFRLNARFSRNLESRGMKPSMRYKTEEDDEGNDEYRVNLQGNLSRKENMSVVKEKYTNIRYKTLELEGEDCSDDEESLIKYDRPNTLVLQAK